MLKLHINNQYINNLNYSSHKLKKFQVLCLNLQIFSSCGEALDIIGGGYYIQQPFKFNLSFVFVYFERIL